MQNIHYNNSQSPSLLRKGAALIMTAVMIGLSLVFSVFLLAFVLIAGVLVMGFLWWKTRGLRKQMRDQPPGGTVFGSGGVYESQVFKGEAFGSEVFKGEVYEGEIIEGEVIRKVEAKEASERS